METPETDEFETLRDAMNTRVWSDYFEALALCRKLEVERDVALSDLEFRRELYALQTKQLDDGMEQRDMLAEDIRITLMENLHLADGDQCTLKRLKDAIRFDLDSPENNQEMANLNPSPWEKPL